jgi:hypothetical protein
MRYIEHKNFKYKVESRVEDFKSIGFDIGGITERTPRTTRYYYLKNIDFDIKSNSQTEVMVVTERTSSNSKVYGSATMHPNSFGKGSRLYFL